MPFSLVVRQLEVFAERTGRHDLSLLVTEWLPGFAKAVAPLDDLPAVGEGLDSVADPRLGHRPALLVADGSPDRPRDRLRRWSGLLLDGLWPDLCGRNRGALATNGGAISLRSCVTQAAAPLAKSLRPESWRR